MARNEIFNYRVHVSGDVKEEVSLQSQVIGVVSTVLESADLDFKLPDDMTVTDKMLYLICHEEVVIKINNTHNANHIDADICFQYHDASLTQPINDAVQKLADRALTTVSLDIKTERLHSTFN